MVHDGGDRGGDGGGDGSSSSSSSIQSVNQYAFNSIMAAARGYKNMEFIKKHKHKNATY